MYTNEKQKKNEKKSQIVRESCRRQRALKKVKPEEQEEFY